MKQSLQLYGIIHSLKHTDPRHLDHVLWRSSQPSNMIYKTWRSSQKNSLRSTFERERRLKEKVNQKAQKKKQKKNTYKYSIF